VIAAAGAPNINADPIVPVAAAAGPSPHRSTRGRCPEWSTVSVDEAGFTVIAHREAVGEASVGCVGTTIAVEVVGFRAAACAQTVSTGGTGGNETGVVGAVAALAAVNVGHGGSDC
jgi:hypothetical protein